MKKRNDPGSKPAKLKKVLSEAEIEKLLDDVDEALFRSDEKRVEDLLGQIPMDHARIPEIIAERLIDGRAQIPLLAFEMLGTFAGEQTPKYLKRIAEDSGVADIVRLGARQRLGWAERGEAKRRLAFLDTLQDAEATLIETIGQADAMWPAAIDTFEEALGYLEAMPGKRRQDLLTRAVSELGVNAAWILKAALHIPDDKTQRIAMAELIKLRPAGAGAEIDRLTRTGRTKRIRSEAAAAYQRLSLHVVDSAPEEKGQPMEVPPVEQVLMSAIDGDGGQVIIVVRRWDEGAYMFADIFHNDHWGIKGAYGTDRAMPEQVAEIVTGLQEEDIGLIEVDLAAARGAMKMAIDVNAATGHTLPPNYALWEPLLHNTYPPPAEEPTIVPELDDAPYAGRNDLIRSSGKLADHEFFILWPFDPLRTWEAMSKAPPPSGGRLTGKQYKPLIEQLVDPQMAAILRRRLRRQAWLLDRAGDVVARDLALAVAAQLAAGRNDELIKQPFLRTLIERSVDRALITAHELSQ